MKRSLRKEFHKMKYWNKTLEKFKIGKNNGNMVGNLGNKSYISELVLWKEQKLEKTKISLKQTYYIFLKNKCQFT